MRGGVRTGWMGGRTASGEWLVRGREEAMWLEESGRLERAGRVVRGGGWVRRRNARGGTGAGRSKLMLSSPGHDEWERIIVF